MYVGYNCDFCIAKEMMGSRPGRICLLYQVDFVDGDYLEYSSTTRLGQVDGIANSIESFQKGVSDLLELHKSDRAEVAFKFFKLPNSRLTGVCPKSFPRTELTRQLLARLNLCLGGEHGNELKHFPESGSLYDQSNIFIESYYIYLDELNKFMRVKNAEKPKREARR